MLVGRFASSTALLGLGCLLSACGGGSGGSASAGTVAVVSAPTAAAPAPTPAPTPTPAPASAVAASSAQVAAGLKALPPVDLSDMGLWNWSGKWMAAEWGNGNSQIPWKFDHVKASGKDAILRLDQNGAPELQSYTVTEAQKNGLWETEVTLPKLRDGLVVAPVYLYDGASKDEIDFEVVGRSGLDATMHAYPGGNHQQSTVKLFAGQDLSNRRMRFGIKVDQTAGLVEMYVDGTLMHRWERSKMSFFVSATLKPTIEMWAADPNNGGFVYWAGKWAGFTQGESLTMAVHGYAYTPLG